MRRPACAATAADLAISVEVLASKLEQALPGRARVERRGSGMLGRGEKRVRRVHVELGPCAYELAVEDGRVQGFRERQSGGIAIKREALSPDRVDRGADRGPARRGRAQRAGAQRARGAPALR